VLAIENAHNDVAGRLLEYGADPNVADSTGTAALYAAVEMNRLGEAPGRPAPKRTGMTDVDLVKNLLDYGADPNARLSAAVLQRHHSGGDATLGAGATPFLRAAKDADVALMALLLARGANPIVTTKNQTNALMFAAGTAGGGLGATVRTTTAERIQAIKLCLQHGVDIDAVNDTGQTALHIAVQSSDEIVSVLAKQHARLDIKDKQGRTPLDVAMGVGGRGGLAVIRESTAALLRQLSIEQSSKDTR
jgi:ankyrin repeat protein